MPKVVVVMGSKSDLEVCAPAVKVLKKYGVETSLRVCSAHRTPNEAHLLASKAIDNGFEVIIAAAGKSAHLAGVLAAYTTLPVIALPIQTSFMGGLDSLLSMVQMPSGIPVATAPVNGGENAGILALQILGIKYPDIRKKLIEAKAAMADAVRADDAAIQETLKSL